MLDDLIGSLWISDLHLSDRSAGDDFQPREKKFNALLSWAIKEKIRQVGIVGDFGDFLETGASEIAKNYGKLLDRLFGNFKTFIISGNHDPLEKMINLVQPYMTPGNFRPIRLCGQELRMEIPQLPGGFIALHGHRFDPEISKYPKIAAAIGTLGGALERHGFPNVDLWFSKFEKWLSEVGRHTRGSKFDDAVMEYGRREKAGLIVAGHTHNGVWNCGPAGSPGRLYYNLGSWTSDEKPCRSLTIREEGIQEVESTSKQVEVLRELEWKDFPKP